MIYRVIIVTVMCVIILNSKLNVPTRLKELLENPSLNQMIIGTNIFEYFTHQIS